MILYPEPAPEGSVDRKNARAVLFSRARLAFFQGSSFYTFVDREDQNLIDALSPKDLDAIFQLIWKGKFSIKE
jgi:hypothetical protein